MHAKIRILVRLGLLFAGAAALIGLDQWTKYLAQTNLVPGQVISLLNLGPLGDVCYLTLAHNTGAFLSLGSNLSGLPHFFLMIVVPLLALAGILYALLSPLWRTQAKPMAFPIQLALGFILAGFSNIIDRMTQGQVIDFLNFGIRNLRTGIMNIADLYLFAAIICLLIYMVRGYKPKAIPPRHQDR